MQEQPSPSKKAKKQRLSQAEAGPVRGSVQFVAPPPSQAIVPSDAVNAAFAMALKKLKSGELTCVMGDAGGEGDAQEGGGRAVVRVRQEMVLRHDQRRQRQEVSQVREPQERQDMHASDSYDSWLIVTLLVLFGVQLEAASAHAHRVV
jgi:hypothetical protein